MKKLIYQIEGHTGVYNSETKEIEQQLSLAGISIENPTNEDVARAAKIAYNGEYEVFDDGQLGPVLTPTQLDIIEAQIAYTAMMTDTLLEV